MEEERRSRYYIEAGAEDRRLAERLASIRSREDAAAITTRQAADERIAVMEQHLEAVPEMRGRASKEGTGGEPRERAAASSGASAREAWKGGLWYAGCSVGPPVVVRGSGTRRPPAGSPAWASATSGSAPSHAVR
jgi:hypothetical protein